MQGKALQRVHAEMVTNQLNLAGGTIDCDLSISGSNGSGKPALNVLSTDPAKQGIFVKQQAMGTVSTHALRVASGKCGITTLRKFQY